MSEKMESRRDEIVADLVWRYVEHLRSTPEYEDAVLNREDLAHLTAVLQVAGTIPASQDDAANQELQAAVRKRLEAHLRESPAKESARPSVAQPSPSGFHPAIFSRWRFLTAAGTICALTITLLTVEIWHRPPATVRTVPVRVRVPDVPGIEPMDERKAHQLMPRMVQNQLTVQEEKDLMWHMLVCPGCFDEYRGLKHSSQTAWSQGARRALVAFR